MICKNCGAIDEGKYCSHCGQKSSVGKITLSSLLVELSDSIFQINHGFFYTLFALFKRPGESIREYLDGKRKKYFKPISYVLTFSTIYFIISKIAGQNTWMDDLISGFSLGAYNAGEVAEIPAALIWFAKNFAYTTLLLLPVFSLASYLAFVGSGKNYLEHIVINSYISGQQAIFYALITLIKISINNELLEVLPVFIAFLYTLWVFWRLFKNGSRIENVLRTILTYILYIVFSSIVLILVMGISELLK